MTIVLSDDYKSMTLELNSCTIVGYTDSKNILIFRLSDEDEIDSVINSFDLFVGNATDIEVDEKITYHLTPIALEHNSRSICYKFVIGGLSWN